MTTKLKPCPFCGSSPDIGGNLDTGFWVRCAGCFASIGRDGKVDGGEAGAVAFWNTRPGEERLKGELAARSER